MKVVPSKAEYQKNGYYIRFNKPTVKGLTILNGVNDNGILESNVQKAAIINGNIF